MLAAMDRFLAVEAFHFGFELGVGDRIVESFNAVDKGFFADGEANAHAVKEGGFKRVVIQPVGTELAG